MELQRAVHFPRVKKKATLKPGCEFFAEVHAVVYFIVLWKVEGFSRFQKYLTALFATLCQGSLLLWVLLRSGLWR